jgi:peptide/nickel transport system substrate-binding protein
MWVHRVKYGGVVATLFALALLIAACGSSGSSSTSPSGSAAAGAPQKGGTLVFARTADLLSLDPTAIADNISIWAEEQIFDTLYTVNQDGKGVHPSLATGYTVSADNLTWTFTLRPGVKFSDGTPLTAADVAFSVNRARKSTQGLGYLDTAITAVTAPDASTVVIKTKSPWAPLLADLSLFTNGVLPANYGGKSAKAFWENPVGTGPFMYQSWKKGQSLTLVRNPNYWQAGKPYLDSIVYSNVSDDNTRALQLQGGQVQIDMSPPFSSIASLKTKPGVQVTLFPSTRVDMLLLNEHVPPLKDVHVRRAISLALDRSAMVTALLFGHGQPANSFMPPTLMYYDPSLPAPVHDLAKAQQEMAASAFPHGFKIVFLTDNTTADMELSQIVQQELKPLGIDVSIRTVDSNQVFTTQQKGDYQMSIEYWTMDIPDPDEDTEWFLSPVGGGNSYFSYYDNPTMNALVASSPKEFDATKRAQIFKQIQALAVQDLPQIYLYYSPYAYAYSSKVNGFFATPLGNQHMEDVWLSK